MELKINKKPCSAHRIAFHSWKMAEINGMMAHGKSFTKCKRCGWIILDYSKESV